MSGRPLIALDARLIGYAAGIARYATLLAEALADLDGPEQFVALRGRRGRDARLGHMPWRTAFTPPHHRLERLVLPLELMARQPWPDVLHSVDHVAPTWGAWKRVVTLHDLAFLIYPETHTEASRAYYAATGDSARRAERVIAVSQRTASDAVRLLGVDPVRMRVVHEAAAPTYRPRSAELLPPLARRLGIDLDRPYILFVGTLEPRKNLVFLIEVFALLRRSLDVQLVLAGSRGWLDEPIFAAHARSGVGNAARFVGPLSEEDLAILYSHAGAFVLPSLYEGFGLPVLEAMACGAPVACSDAGPLPEVAGDAAILLAPDDTRGWTDTLGQIVTNPRLAEGLRARGFVRSAEFSWQRTAEATRDVYREALLA
jgi:glycosyltransferase involved in cell wall biosynthesis